MSNLQTYYHFKLDFQKVDQHTGGKWLIHGTKRRKDNQLCIAKYQWQYRLKYPRNPAKPPLRLWLKWKCIQNHEG